MREGPDLFGQIPVTAEDVRAWCRAVAGLDADSTRGQHYVRAWCVPEKIAEAKRRGLWNPLQEQG